MSGLLFTWALVLVWVSVGLVVGMGLLVLFLGEVAFVRSEVFLVMSEVGFVDFVEFVAFDVELSLILIMGVFS